MSTTYIMIQKLLTVLLFSSVLFNCQETSTSDAKPVILFICEHGAARSPIAAAHFNKLAEEQNLNYTAIFRGTDPNDALTTGTEIGLKNDGIDTNGWTPTRVSQNDINDAYKIVTFDLILPASEEVIPVEKWDGTPPISQDYDIARDMIVKRVNQLIGVLPKSKVE